MNIKKENMICYMKHSLNFSGEWKSPMTGYYTSKKEDEDMTTFINKCNANFPILQYMFKDGERIVNVISQPFSYQTLYNIWSEIEDKYLYEFINPTRNIVFFDFEREEDEQFDENDFFHVVESEIKRRLKEPMFTWTRTNHPVKKSYHLYICNYYFECKNIHDQLKFFAQSLNLDKYQDMLDLKVYRKNGSLRMVHSKKPDNDYYHDFVGKRNPSLRKTFMTPSNWYGWKIHKIPSIELEKKKKMKTIDIEMIEEVKPKINEIMNYLEDYNPFSKSLVSAEGCYFYNIKLKKSFKCSEKIHRTPELYVRIDKYTKKCNLYCSCKKLII